LSGISIYRSSPIYQCLPQADDLFLLCVLPLRHFDWDMLFPSLVGVPPDCADHDRPHGPQAVGRGLDASICSRQELPVLEDWAVS
jgi:hypothetical protein